MRPTLSKHSPPTTVNWLYALWKFARPHTIIGTSLSVIGLALMALALSITPVLKQPWTVTANPLLLILGAWVPCICGNIYIVGLNQLEDIEIDKINKPTLPLASGEFSLKEGQLIVATTGILALLLSGFQSVYLFLTIVLSLAIGTAYSLPPLRLKRYPFWAALCIFGVRGIIVNLGFFLHFQVRLGGAGQIPPEVWALTGFMIPFAFAIAIAKDIPDIEGDRRFQIRTFSIRLGARRVFHLARWVLTGAYGGMMLVAWRGLPSVQPLVVVLTHLGLVALLWERSWQVDLAQKTDIKWFYQWIWKLFFLEYIVFPITCLWD